MKKCSKTEFGLLLWYKNRTDFLNRFLNALYTIYIVQMLSAVLQKVFVTLMNKVAWFDLNLSSIYSLGTSTSSLCCTQTYMNFIIYFALYGVRAQILLLYHYLSTIHKTVSPNLRRQSFFGIITLTYITTYNIIVFVYSIYKNRCTIALLIFMNNA